MISISPIHQTEGDRPYREFFQTEFCSQRLGRPGRWQGRGATLLSLQNPVELSAFQNLLAGRTPNGGEVLGSESSARPPELGWRITIGASPSLTVLWALAPQPVRARLEDTHASSVRHALWNFEAAVSGWDWRQDEGHDAFPAALLATFRCGAAWDQTPHLHTTAFLFNLAFHRDGTVGTFTTDQVRQQRFQLQTTYEQMRDTMLWGDIGAYREIRGADLRIVGVPQELCRRFCFDPSFSPQNAVEPGQRPKPLRSDQLFAAWSQKAEEWGWGPKQAGDFLREARWERRLQDLVEQWRSGLSQGEQLAKRAVNSVKQLMPVKQSQAPRSDQDKHQRPTHSH
jgi:hypothetical protein